jgi:hypothetical protein
VPVLARTLESAGFSTILVTMMPFWAERIGVPRTLAVEFPFAQTLGQPHDTAQQRRVLLQALDVLESVDQPGTIVDSPETWPQPTVTAIKEWQPPEPSPVIKALAPRIRSLLRERRKKKSSQSSAK